MANENQDLAVLGFKIKTTGADAAFDHIMRRIQAVNDGIKDADTILENKITESMRTLGTVVRGINAAANSLTKNSGVAGAFKSFAKFAIESKNLSDNARSIQNAIELMSNARLSSMARNLAKAFAVFDAGVRIVDFEMRLANPKLIDDLRTDLLIKLDSDTKQKISDLKASIDALTNGVVARIVPEKGSIAALKQEVQDGIQPEIKFDNNTKKIVGDLYSAIRDGIKQQGPILVPLQFTFGKPKSDHPSTSLSDPEKQARDDLRKTLEEYAKDFGGMGGLNAVWDKAILGGPEAIEKIRRVLATRTTWLEKAISDSLDKAKLKPSKYGELVEQGLESIPVDVANTVDKLASQLKGLLKRHQEEFTFRPEIGTATQSEDDIKGVLADLASRVQKVSKKEFNSLPIPIGSVTLRPNNVLVSPVDAKNVYFATESIDADLKEAVLRPKSIKIDASAIPEGKTQLVGGEAFTAASKQISIPVPSVFIKPQNLLVSPLADEVAFLGESIAADVKETVLYPDKITIDASVLEQKNIKVTPDMLKASIKGVVGTTKSITIDTTAIPSDKVTTVGGRLNVNVNEVLVHPKSIKVDAAFVNPDNVSLINGNTIADALQKEPLKITTKINLDPLPSDEIEKLDKLVSRLYDVQLAYSNIQNIASQLKNTVRELDAAMSEEVKQLIKNGIVASAGSKTGLRATDPLKDIAHMALEATRIANEAEKAQKRQQKEAEKALKEQQKKQEKELKLQEKIKEGQEIVNKLREPVDMGPSNARNEKWKELLDNMVEVNKAAGNYAENQSSQNKEAVNVQTKFIEGQNKITDEINKTAEEAAKETAKIRANARAFVEDGQATAKARAEMASLNRELKRIGWRIDNMPRVEPTKLVDPFIRLKAELGETNSRLIDIGRTFGIYFSARTIVNYFRQAAESANAFGMEIRRIQSLATDFDFSNLRNELMDIDARFGNVLHNAQALYWAYSSGVRGTEKELASFVETMSKTATTIKADVMPTVDAATSIMNAWNLSASSAAEIGDLLFGIVKYGKSNAQQLTTSLGHVVAPAAALNIELNELGAAAATLTKTMKTNRAFTYLSNILGKMASPTKAVQEAAAELGIELSASAIKARGFANTLADIRRATGGDIGKIAKIFPDLRGQRAAITLLSTQYKDFEQQLENMQHKAGSMEEALSKIADSPDAQLRALRNTMSMIAINAGDAANHAITLGGALTPLLKAVNGLEHKGREILGHLTAAAGTVAAIAVSMKVIKAAQFAAAQASYQMASADTEINKLSMNNALLDEQRALEANNMLKADMQRNVLEKQLNDELLRELRNRENNLMVAKTEAQEKLKQYQTEAKFMNESIRMQFNERIAQMGGKQNKVSSLKSWLTELTTGEGQRNLRAAANLIERLNADIQIDNATLQGGRQKLQGEYERRVQRLVETNKEVQEKMETAMLEGNIGLAEKEDTLLGKIASIIKRTSIISGQMAKFDQNGQLLEREVRRVILATKQKELVSGLNYEHSLLVQFVKDELSVAQNQLQLEQNKLKNIMQQNGASEEAKVTMERIAQLTMDVQRIDAERVVLQTQISDRTRDLTGRQADQVKLLDAAAKAAKELLLHDTEDLEKLKEKAEIEMKHASLIGPKTLAATKAALAVEMESRTLSMQINALQAERNTLIDSENNWINETEEAKKRVAEIDKEKNALLEKRNELEREFLALGIKAGNQDARNLKILRMTEAKREFADVVDALARDKGVVNEAVKRMSAEVGKGIFGGRLGGKGAMGLSIASSLIPGMGKWGMTASMLTGLDVFGKAASGMTRLTAGTLQLLGTTEKLQKKGVMGLEKGIEDLTKTLMTGVLWTKKQALANQALQALGGNSAGMAAWATKATWMTAGLGIAGILGGAIVAGLLMYFKTEKGGPLGDLAESMFGLDRLKRENDFLDARREWMKASASENDEMLRNMKRMRESFAGNQININGLKANLTNVQNVVSGQIVDGTAALLSAQNIFVNDMSADLSKIKYDIGALKLKQKQLKKNLDDAYSKIGASQARLTKGRNAALYSLYYSAIEYGMRTPAEFFKFGFDEKIWIKALKNATFDPKVLFATPASSFSKQQQKYFSQILSAHGKWFDFIPLLSEPYKLYEAYEDELAKNKSQIKQLQDEARRLNNFAHGKGMSKQMAETINSAMTPIPQDVINSSVDAERKLYAALNGIGKGIQAESAFELHVYEMQQKEMQRINEAISKLELHSKWQNFAKLMPEYEAQLENLKKDRDNLERAIEITSSSSSNFEAVKDYRKLLRGVREEIAAKNQQIADLKKDEDAYNQWLEGMAEFRYQILRESMENDLSSAMAPMRDSTERLELAKKMTERSFNNMSFVLGRGGELADLTGKTMADIQEMVRQINNDLAMPMQRAKDEYDQLNIGLKKLKDGTEAYNEQSKLLKDAESKMNEVSKEYNDKIDAIRTASQNLYTNLIGEVTAFVDNALEIVKERDFRAKYMSLFSNVDESFRTRTEDLKYLEETMKQLDEQYSTMTGAFAKMDPETARKAHRGAKRKLDNAIMQARISYISDLKSTSQSVAGFMENIANDMMNQSKSLFEFRMGDRAYASMRPALIKQRMGMLSNILSGKNGLYAQINNALELAQKRRSAQDFTGAMQALEDAKKYGAQARGIEEEKLDLIKKQADTEREINSSMYQLANTLRGQFAATTQQSVAADSVEALRLMSRQFGENITPPMSTSYQEQERRYREQRMAQDKIFYQNLMTAATTLQTEIGEASKNASTNSVAAKTMETAADKANSAADTFTKAVESSKTIFRIRRI